MCLIECQGDDPTPPAPLEVEKKVEKKAVVEAPGEAEAITADNLDFSMKKKKKKKVVVDLDAFEKELNKSNTKSKSQDDDDEEEAGLNTSTPTLGMFQ